MSPSHRATHSEVALTLAAVTGYVMRLRARRSKIDADATTTGLSG